VSVEQPAQSILFRSSSTHFLYSSLVGSRHLGLVGGRATFFIVGVGVCVGMGVAVLAMSVCSCLESQNIALVGCRHGTLVGGRHHSLLGGRVDVRVYDTATV
jgi:hypothetical protein